MEGWLDWFRSIQRQAYLKSFVNRLHAGLISFFELFLQLLSLDFRNIVVHGFSFFWLFGSLCHREVFLEEYSATGFDGQRERPGFYEAVDQRFERPVGR
jgi:hypothetical protein